MKDEKLKTYLFSYRHDGADWAIELYARDERDALVRRAKLASARLDGVVVATLPASQSWLVKALTFARNALHPAQ